MRLEIENLAKIRYADIIIDGITVITGENNTGKSTIGKVLYATFGALYNLDEKIEERRKQEIQTLCSGLMRDLMKRGEADFDNSSRPLAYNTFLSKKVGAYFYKQLLEQNRDTLDKAFVYDLLIQTFEYFQIHVNTDAENLDETIQSILDRIKRSDNELSVELASRFFNKIFDSQITCLRRKNEVSSVRLRIKGKDLIFKFEKNRCIMAQQELDILHEAFFIDNPFVLDELSALFNHNPESLKGIRLNLAERLSFQDEDLMEGIFDAVSAKNNLREIYHVLNQITDGDVINQKGEWFLKTDRFDEPIHLENLSAGLKSFVLIKMLLEKGILKEKDVLILDEPEIHLHPEWQLKYAEIIVLLQKRFDLSIVVATHSRDFLEALELYSQKYDLESRCNYYLSKQEDGLVTFENVTGELEKVYSQMITASMLLDKLRYELVDEDE